MRGLFSKAWLRALSGLFINFSAASYITGVSGLNIFPPATAKEIFALIFYFALGTIFLVLVVKIEEILQK